METVKFRFCVVILVLQVLSIITALDRPITYNNFESRSNDELILRLEVEGGKNGSVLLQDLSKFRDVKELIIRGNGLTKIQPNLFEGLIQLETLRINHEYHLHTLERNIFKGLNKLEYLDLSSNGLKSLEPGVFNIQNNSRDHLIQLKLEKNSIEKINEHVFNELSVYDLSISQNRISQISNRAFSGLIAEFLDLSNNKLKTIDSLAFDNMNVHVLDLSNNPISQIENDVFLFIPLTRLYLNRGNMNITDKRGMGISEDTEVILDAFSISKKSNFSMKHPNHKKIQ